MAKLLRIDDCSDCAHFSANVTCDLSGGREVDGDCDIPDWCPLPEAEEATASEWVSTSEREPKEGVSVPVVVEHGDGTRVLATGVYMGRGLEWSVNGYMRVVTHWLDIPPLPEGATDE